MRRFYAFCYILSLLPLFTHAQEPLKVSFGDLRARQLGPAVMSGRISSLDAVHTMPHIQYIGAASGGVWKSTSAGATFLSVFDDYNQSVGDIAIDQAHPDTVWVGTGESWVRNSVSPGDGIYVTTNGGKSWMHKGLNHSFHIAKVLIDPRQSGTIYVAVQGKLWGDHEERGVYKTTDFGATWERILFVDQRTGAADLTMDPRNPDVLYASMWEHRREPDFFISGGPGSALYKTTDGGKNWQKLEGNGLPPRPYGRIAVEVAPSAPDTVYATIEAKAKEDKGMYRSFDAGATWKKVSSDFNTYVRPFYFSRITVDPKDPMKVYKCGLNLIISDNGGETFRQVGSGVHSDIHDVWVDPQNGRHVLIGTDGGTYESYDGGYNFRMYMNLPISQFYQVSVDDAVPFNVYGGLQDNGTWKGPSSNPGGIQNSDWKFLLGGDGFQVMRHKTEKDVVYGESQGGNLSRIELNSGQAKLIKPLPGEGEPPYRFNWSSPIALSPTHPERLYFAAQFLFRSENRGNSWEKISPDLTSNNPDRQRQKESGGLSLDNSTAENNTTIVCIAESPKNDQIIWAGTDDGNLQVTANGGKNWENVALNIGGLPPHTWCTNVAPDRFETHTAYATFDGHTQGDTTTYVFKTTDLGKSWVSLVTNEVQGYAWYILQDVVNPNLLFLGTEQGLFITMDGGLSWQRFKNNFPRVSVRWLAIQERDHALAIATHGRGIYLIDDLRPLRQMTNQIVDKDFHILDMGKTVIKLGRGGSWFGGAGNFVAGNPSGNAQIVYYMKKRHTFGKMHIEVLGTDGKVIQELPAGKSAGINIVELPVRYPMPKVAPSNNRMALFGSMSTPSLGEGAYTVRIIKGKEVYETQIELEEEAALYYPVEARKIQSDLLKQLYNQSEQLGYLYYAATDIYTWADSLSGKAKGKKDALALKSLGTGIQTWRDSLVSMDGDGYVAENEALREEISTLYLQISGYPGEPSRGQIRKVTHLMSRMEEHQGIFSDYQAQSQRLNTKLLRQGIPPLKIRTWEEFKKG
ncbi:MAG: hypothetical protein KA479_03930 [Saprospiraceae bacterium]|nr:hypothetical protein [Saprospiraceae bacterium]